MVKVKWQKSIIGRMIFRFRSSEISISSFINEKGSGYQCCGSGPIYQCCGTGPFFPDPRVRFWKYGSGSGSYLVLRYVFDVYQNKYLYDIFLPNLNILWHLKSKIQIIMQLKIKDKKIISTKLYFRQFYNEKIWRIRIRIRNTGFTQQKSSL